ncbi:MAG: AAA domain-containing protein [Phycisphaera sp.]|nr:AAA domain-containing protein [Phycisphaera sp.]
MAGRGGVRPTAWGNLCADREAASADAAEAKRPRRESMTGGVTRIRRFAVPPPAAAWSSVGTGIRECGLFDSDNDSIADFAPPASVSVRAKPTEPPDMPPVHGSQPVGDERVASPPRVVVHEPDAHASAAVLRHLKELGMAAVAVSDLKSVGEAARRSGAQIVVADLGDDNRRLHALLSDLSPLRPRPTVIAIATHLPAARAVRWMRGGVDDIVFKPLRAAEFRAALERAIERHALACPDGMARSPAPNAHDGPVSRVERTRTAATPQSDGDAVLTALVGDDPRLRRALELARAASRVRSTVLIQGETGTGKSTLARAIHLASPRCAAPFVEIACGSVPESLLESELFGHVKGAFTGSVADKKGRFLAANGGTIFLDEINTAPPQMQVKLLRVLQERAFEPVGSDETIEVDVRVVVASNTPLERLVEQGRFSPDLFYRVHVLQIDLPPLRERMRDLERLANHFLRQKADELGRRIVGFSQAAFDALRRHAWPGNVRELEHAVERAVILSDGDWVEASALPDRVRRGDSDRAPRTDHPLRLNTDGADARGSESVAATESAPRTREDASLAAQVRGSERAALVEALEAAAWNRSRAARALGINRTTLYRKMRDLGLDGGRAAG